MSILSIDYRKDNMYVQYHAASSMGFKTFPWLQHRHNERVVADLAEFMLLPVKRGQSRVVISDALIPII